MRIIITFLFSITSFITNAQAFNTLNLMPVPKSITLENGKFLLTSGFTIVVQADKTDSILFLSVNRMYHSLNRRTGLFFHQENIGSIDNIDTAGLIVRVKQKSGMSIGLDESYQIKITTKQLLLEANYTIGALRGLETILQLTAIDETGFSHWHQLKMNHK
jgi:hexosaminidase